MNTTYFKNLIMGNVFRTSATPAIPTSYYIGLSSTAPNLSGGNVTEPSATGTAYQRVQLSTLSTPSGGVISNSGAITFPESTGVWFPSTAPATHYVIFDAATGGNLLMYNALTSPRIIETSTVAVIREGSLTLQLTD